MERNDADAEPMSFMEAAAFQWINAKAGPWRFQQPHYTLTQTIRS